MEPFTPRWRMTLGYLSSFGMVTPLGLRADSSVAAMTAGVCRFEESDYRDNAGNPIVVSRLGAIAPTLPHRERVLQMLALSVEEALRNRPEAHTGSIPILLVLGEIERSRHLDGLTQDLHDTLRDALGWRLDLQRSETSHNGYTGGFRALHRALHVLATTDAPCCLVAGVDSMLHASSLLWLNRSARLKTETQTDGVVPGEAAACVLVDRNEGPLRILGIGAATEPSTRDNDTPLRGEGMTLAGQRALHNAGLSMTDMDLRIADIAGESYAAREHTLAVTRLLRSRKEIFPLWLPAETLGDTGAASGLVQLVLAAHAGTNGQRYFCSSSGVQGDCVVAIVERQQGVRT
jgi:3-oxoacyl-[acyl-carrier-protein] synthase I